MPTSSTSLNQVVLVSLSLLFYILKCQVYNSVNEFLSWLISNKDFIHTNIENERRKWTLKKENINEKNVFVHCCIIVERTDATSDKLRDAMCVQQKGAQKVLHISRTRFLSIVTFVCHSHHSHANERSYCITICVSTCERKR